MKPLSSHELAHKLLAQPDQPVVMGGEGSDEGMTVLLGSVSPCRYYIGLELNSSGDYPERRERPLLTSECSTL